MPYKDKNQAREAHRRWRKANPERVKLLHTRDLENLRTSVFTYYGNGNLACVRCGFVDVRALSIDHINGDRTGDGGLRGKKLYRFLRKSGYPEGYQTLCMNCQSIKRFENKEYN